jgi:5'-nucleotidase
VPGRQQSLDTPQTDTPSFSRYIVDCAFGTQFLLSMRTPRILVCNDDGIFSNGIRTLVSRLRSIAHVDVVAPNAQQSAVGHAVTVSVPLRVEKYEHGGDFFGWAVNGTPADCVKLASQHILPSPPDLLISGINHGRNTAVSLVYSGTVSGATEGTMLGIPSIAVSLDDLSMEADFTAAAEIAVKLARIVLHRGLPPGVSLNVNVPALPLEEIRGIRIVPQGESYWNDVYDERKDPMGRSYFWLHGDYVTTGDDTDDHAIDDGFVAVTPIHYRLTDDESLEMLHEWGLEGMMTAPDTADETKQDRQEPQSTHANR